MSRKIVLCGIAAGSAAACAFLIVAAVHKGLADAAVWAAVVAAVAGVIAAAAALWVAVPQPSKLSLPPKPEIPGWVVDRPKELTAVVAALVAGEAGTVGITTTLYGAGGFGKTILAHMVCADRHVRRHFGGRVHIVTVGRDVRGAAAIAAKVNEVIKLIFDKDATFTDPQLAGQHLGALLDVGPRRLLVLDDVWEAGQLAPFTDAGKECVRLVTTRVPGLTARRGPSVYVDQMSQEQAEALLIAGLPQLSPTVVQGLLEVTGRWPLLLRLVNTSLASYNQLADDVPTQAAVLLNRLRTGGPAVMDDLRGTPVMRLDVGEPRERERAVRATISASTSLLDPSDAARFVELSVFVEDEVIPLSLVARLWQATAALDDRDDLQAAQVCERLAQLALVTQAAGSARGITLHDVIREFLRAELGPQRLADLNVKLLDKIAEKLPAPSSQDPALQAVQVAWWELSQEDRYLWDHLIEHLRDAGRSNDAEAVAGDLRWIGARLRGFGPAAPAADLSVVRTKRATRMRAVLAQTAHLLAPTDPSEAVVDILHSRVADDADWGPQVNALQDSCRHACLINHWPLPDLADRALLRVLAGHTSVVSAVAVAPDGSWLASGGGDEAVRIWDVTAGQELTVLKGRAGPVAAVAIAPDGSWLASSGGEDGTVRIWNVATGRKRAVLKGYSGPVAAVAIAPDGSWLASGGEDGTVRIWNVATGRKRAVLKGHSGPVAAVAIAPDGSWLASGGEDGTVQTWDVAAGRQLVVLKSDAGAVAAVAVAPDGSWLAAGGEDGAVRIWDVAAGRELGVLKGNAGPVAAVAVAPDGSWLASGSGDGAVRIWDAATRREVAVLHGHISPVAAVTVAPDGGWLASVSWDHSVRIWDVAARQNWVTLRADTGPVSALTAAPDGSWLASDSGDGAVRIWDVTARQWLASGGGDRTARIWRVGVRRERAVLHGHSRAVTAVAVAPDGSWLASGGGDGAVRIWDVAAGRELGVLKGNAGPVAAVAVAPDGSWLASGGGDGAVRIWDVAAERELGVLKGNAGPVAAVAVAPDGSWLASGGGDGAVRIWDVAAERELAVLKGHTGAVAAVTVTPDGRWLASGSRDRSVRESGMWPLVGSVQSCMATSAR